MEQQRMAIFASGTGSNAVNLINYFSDHLTISIACLVCNRKDARALSSAEALGIQTHCFSNAQVADGDFLRDFCLQHEIDWIVLAGYLRKIPDALINAYEDKIINLHPSLLPKYGGKGMYGQHVHRAVLKNEERETGITIHFVNQEFDQGKMIAQFYCTLQPEDDLRSVEEKIKQLEHNYLPWVVEKTMLT